MTIHVIDFGEDFTIAADPFAKMSAAEFCKHAQAASADAMFAERGAIALCRTLASDGITDADDILAAAKARKADPRIVDYLETVAPIAREFPDSLLDILTAQTVKAPRRVRGGSCLGF